MKKPDIETANGSGKGDLGLTQGDQDGNDYENKSKLHIVNL